MKNANDTLPEYTTNIIARDNGVDLDFDNATQLRQKARLSGMNPNYWYPAEWSGNVKRGTVLETQFWSHSIALFRMESGAIAALENRCPHRHLPLTMGHVKGCNVVCLYHGWSYGADGQLNAVAHHDFDRKLPNISVRSYPVQERYGLIWIFPGDPALAADTELPVIPNTADNGCDDKVWARLGFDYSWQAHHSMVMDNLCNLTHLYVHGNWVPYDETALAHSDLDGEQIKLVWSHTLRRRDILWPIYNKMFRLPDTKNTSTTHDLYDYPYHVALQNNRIRTVNLMLPKSRTETRVFTLQYWKPLDIPLLNDKLRFKFMQRIIMPLIRPVAREVFRQDGATVEAEMEKLPENFFKPTPELNHSVKLFDKLNIERWQAWLDHINSKTSTLPQQSAKVLLDRDIEYKIHPLY